MSTHVVNHLAEGAMIIKHNKYARNRCTDDLTNKSPTFLRETQAYDNYQHLAWTPIQPMCRVDIFDVGDVVTDLDSRQVRPVHPSLLEDRLKSRQTCVNVTDIGNIEQPGRACSPMKRDDFDTLLQQRMALYHN